MSAVVYIRWGRPAKLWWHFSWVPSGFGVLPTYLYFKGTSKKKEPRNPWRNTGTSGTEKKKKEKKKDKTGQDKTRQDKTRKEKRRKPKRKEPSTPGWQGLPCPFAHLPIQADRVAASNISCMLTQMSNCPSTPVLNSARAPLSPVPCTLSSPSPESPQRLSLSPQKTQFPSPSPELFWKSIN